MDIIKQLQKWDMLSLNDRHAVVSKLRELGRVSKAAKKEKLKHELACPIHKQSIVTDCKLKDCKFNVDYGWSKNCVLYYMNEHGKQKLLPEEISFLYQIPTLEVKDNIKKAFVYIRKTLLKEKIEDLKRNHKIKRAYFLKDRCVNCGQELKDIGIDLRLPKGYGWCSAVCKTSKPYDIFKIEKDFGINHGAYLEIYNSLFRGANDIG